MKATIEFTKCESSECNWKFNHNNYHFEQRMYIQNSTVSEFASGDAAEDEWGEWDGENPTINHDFINGFIQFKDLRVDQGLTRQVFVKALDKFMKTIGAEIY